MINFAHNKNICAAGLVYFEQQILALLFVFHRTYNLSCNKYHHIRSTPSKSTNQRAAFLQPAKNLLLRDRLIMQGEKCKTSIQKFQRNNVARQVEGFCISYFAALMDHWSVVKWVQWDLIHIQIHVDHFKRIFVDYCPCSFRITPDGSFATVQV